MAATDDVTIKTISDMAYYQGPNAVPGIKFHSAARELGVTAWGMGLLEIEAGCTGYPEHDHLADGQEEVYVIVRGSAILTAGGEQYALEQGAMVRVAPETKRKFVAGPEGLALLAIGATSGKAYQPRR
jgi:mannose-6-phosphate isomerase-like protein (cupin superfamily)